MSKTITKAIAVLGVIAGLGVAILPLSSYAATSDLPIALSVLASGAGDPDCDPTPAQTVNCDVPGTNNPTGQNIVINDKDSRLALCLDSVNSQSASSENCTTHLGATVSLTTWGTYNDVIPTISAAINNTEAAFTANGGRNAVASPRGYGVRFTEGVASVPQYGTPTIPASNTAYFLPVTTTPMIRWNSAAPVADTTITAHVAGEYKTSNLQGRYTNTLVVTTALNP